MTSSRKTALGLAPIICPQFGEWKRATFSRKMNGFCPQKRYGCRWSGPPTEVELHRTEDCPFRLLNCHMCGDELMASNLDDHCSAQCRKRFYKCEYCGEGSDNCTFEDIKENHWPVCRQVPVPCCNSRCAKGSIARSEYAKHVKEEYELLVSVNS